MARLAWGGMALIAIGVLPEVRAQQAGPSPPIVEKMVPIGMVPEGWTGVRGSWLASPNSERVTFKVSSDDGGVGQTVLVDNEFGPSGSVIFGPTFSSDSSQLATVVSMGGQGRLQIDDQTMVGPDPVAAPVFSPDGKRVAYVGREGKQQLVFADGRSSVVYDSVLTESLSFSDDSMHLAYVARRGDAWFVVMDGQEGVSYLQIASLVFSPDSQRLAYWAMKPGGGWTVVADGQENALMSAQQQAGLVFSPDSSKLAAFVRRNGRWHVAVDGVFGQGYDALGKGSLTFSPNSEHIVYAAVDGQRWKIILDDALVGEFDGLLAGSLQFSPSSSHLAYIAEDDNGWFVVIDNHRHRSFDRISSRSLQFSPDSQRIAYVAKNQTERVSVVVDGYRWAICDGVEAMKFSPDSASVVWVERRGQTSSVVVDGIRGNARFDQLVPGASLIFDSSSTLHTMVLRRPGPVFFQYQAQLYPSNEIDQAYPDSHIISTGDTMLDDQ